MDRLRSDVDHRFSSLGEVHFKVKMTTSMGKLKKSYAERQGKNEGTKHSDLMDLFCRCWRSDIKVRKEVFGDCQ